MRTSLGAAESEAIRKRTAVLIVPGMFGDCLNELSVPFGDGVSRSTDRIARDGYGSFSDLGLGAMRMVPLPGRQRSTENAKTLASEINRELLRDDIDRILLVGYSKGVIDSLEALRILDLSLSGKRKSLSLVSVAGPIMGSPFADRFEAVYRAISPRVNPFNCSASDGDDISSVTRLERRKRMTEQVKPEGVSYFSIAVRGQPNDFAIPLRILYRQLERVGGDNDGQILLSDSILPNSQLLAIAKSDHWSIALPRGANNSWLLHAISSKQTFPRVALLRAVIGWVIEESNPQVSTQ